MKKQNEPVDWLRYENEASEDGSLIVCGVDEAGRGPLAGPVFAAAVVLHKGQIIEGANDSKKLSEKKREALFDVIISEAADYCIASVDEKTIDEINILNATKLGVKRALEALKTKPDLLMLDALNNLDTLGIPYMSIIKGDAKSLSIAAASIIAKVTRDRMLIELDKKYPMYDFKHNKGYGTKKHLEAIEKYGITKYHRLTFKPVSNYKDKVIN